MAAIVNGNEIVLTGTVGRLFWDDCFDYADVIMALATVGRDQDVIIRLNSGGGIATQGSAIHAAIQAHRGRKTIVVEGIAGSAASVIAMAGDEVVMSLGALLMIHDPSGLTFGTVADHELQIAALNAIGDAMAGIYADKTGKTAEDCRAAMRAETWLTPDQAVVEGYADRVGMVAANDDGSTKVIEGSEEQPAPEPVPTAFDYRLYKNSPERLVALADSNGWAQRSHVMAAAPAAPSSTRQPKGTEMANETQAGAKPAPAAAPDMATAQTDERSRIAAILDCEEARGRDDLARHFAFHTSMTADDAKAALVKAPTSAPATAPAAPAAQEPNRFDAAMATVKNPPIGADSTGAQSEADEVAAEAAKIVALHRGKAA